MPFSPPSRHALVSFAFPLLFAQAGCDHDHDHDGGPSVVTGTIARATFPREVERITVHEVNGGARSGVDVEADGTFEAELRTGGTYRLLLSPGGNRWPITLRSGLGRLDTTVFVASGGAVADLGELRFWPGGTAGRAALVGAEGVEPVACSAGSLESGEPCASGEAAVRCEDRKHGKGHRKHHHRHHDDDHEDKGRDADEPECMDGLDEEGQSCNGGPTAFDASAFEAQAIPTANLPELLACPDDDDDDDDHDDDDDDDDGD